MIEPGLFKRLNRRLGILNRIRGLPAVGFDLEGEKLLDWGWVVAHLPRSPRQRILDVGCCQSPVIPVASALGHEVVGIDTDRLPYQVPDVAFYQGDFLELDLGAELFDVVVLCSVVEHVGLPGRYRQKNIPDGDLQAMQKTASLLKPNGIVILTVPVGVDMIFAPWHRIYGSERLSGLIERFLIESECFFIKQPGNPWRLAQRAEAMTFDRNGLSYALGQFVLKTRGG
jgi:SAM-dependent methyltransferase